MPAIAVHAHHKWNADADQQKGKEIFARVADFIETPDMKQHMICHTDTYTDDGIIRVTAYENMDEVKAVFPKWGNLANSKEDTPML